MKTRPSAGNASLITYLCETESNEYNIRPYGIEIKKTGCRSFKLSGVTLLNVRLLSLPTSPLFPLPLLLLLPPTFPLPYFFSFNISSPSTFTYLLLPFFFCLFFFYYLLFLLFNFFPPLNALPFCLASNSCTPDSRTLFPPFTCLAAFLPFHLLLNLLSL